MICKAWSSIEEVPYCFSKSFITFKVTPDRKSPILIRIERLRTVTPVWIHQWFGMMHNAWCRIEEMPYCFSVSSIKFQGYMSKVLNDLNPILIKISRPVAAIESIISALSNINCDYGLFTSLRQATPFQNYFHEIVQCNAFGSNEMPAKKS